MENQPRVIFERLFGDTDTTDPAERLARAREDRSILDAVSEEVKLLAKRLGPRDRAKLTEYLDSIEDVERRIKMAEAQSSQELPVLERPAGVPSNYEEHAKLMIDLQALAYQCDLTRVITFALGREQSERAYRELGISDGHHPLSHHQNDPKKIAPVLQIDIYHSKMFAYFLEKFQSTPDGDGSLLDHSLIIYGSSLSNGNLHLHEDLPVLLAGGGSRIKAGRHIRYPSETPMANLYLTALEMLGIGEESLGDSTGRLEL
jgi:hypothetical protein